MIRHLKDHVFLYFFFLVTCSVIGAAHIGLNGQNVWRQADVYAHILGFLGFKGMQPLHDFLGVKTIYDIPIYEFLVASVSRLVGTSPIVAAHFINLATWALTAIYGAMIAERLSPGSRVYYWALAATSPLFLHYYATALPDVMATGLSAMAIARLMDERYMNPRALSLTIAALVVAALIKSPVPFIFLVFYVTNALLNPETTAERAFSRHNIMVYAAAALAALSAEYIRRLILGTDVGGFAQDPSWYFGTAALRLSADYWLVMGHRLLTEYAQMLFSFLIILSLFYFFEKTGRRGLRLILPSLIAFFSGWLIFANVFSRHNYYQIPGVALLFVAASVVLNTVVQALAPQASPLTRRFVGRDFPPVVLALMMAVSPLLMIYGYRLSNYNTDTIFEATRYLLRDSNHFIWVSDNDNGPIPGGLIATPFTHLSTAEFEKNCEKILSEDVAVIAAVPSPCLDAHRQGATTYARDA